MNLNKTSILTATGNYFCLLNPDPSLIDIETIAHALSHICRFTGHTQRFYSVAQHSVLVSLEVPKELALSGLLHDAAEAFLGDVSTPLKQMLPDYRVLEQHLESLIFKRFGLDFPPDPLVKTADIALLATEKRDLMPKSNLEWAILDGVVPRSELIDPLLPEFAKLLFMNRYWEIVS